MLELARHERLLVQRALKRLRHLLELLLECALSLVRLLELLLLLGRFGSRARLALRRRLLCRLQLLLGRVCRIEALLERECRLRVLLLELLYRALQTLVRGVDALERAYLLFQLLVALLHSL